MIKAPDGERYFAIVGVNQINFEDPKKAKHKIAFNLTSLSDERLTMEMKIQQLRTVSKSYRFGCSNSESEIFNRSPTTHW